ncbi:zinc finger protein 408 isoform X2 [Oncorhynchus mykiss]|uniref:zinc finger protein 408 isoform X2 n=1 Tax=Oncorhynchus mykiss TaxID=8022 RepID=UPI001878C98A|nr:zinc finger protein 408 isoform X2 [Oncorhynchus mykiss]
MCCLVRACQGLTLSRRILPPTGGLMLAAPSNHSLMEEVYQTIIKGNLWDRCYWIRFACNARRKDEHNITVHEVDGSLFLRACKDINPRTELLLWSFLADPLEHDGSQGGSLTTPGKPRKQVTPRKSREDGSPDVNSTEQELKLIESMVVEEEKKSQTGIKRSKPLIYKMNKRCVRDSHSSGEKTMEQNREVHSCKIIKTECFSPEITNVPCSGDKLVSPADEPSKSSEEPDNVVGKPQEVQGPQVVRASCRRAAEPRKVHSLVSCIHKRLQVCKNGYLDRQVTLEITSRVGDENGRACQETDIKAGENISSDEIPKDLDKGGKQDTEEFMMAPDLFNTRESVTSDQCDKSFFQLYHLKKHKFTHLGLKPYLCTECGRNYSSQENFRAHLLMHKGERPFKCQQRDKSYGLKRDLKEHEVLHTGERPFVCDICGKAFARWPSVFIGRPTALRKKITMLLSSSALSAVTNWPIQAPLGITCACKQENGLMPVPTAIRHSDSGGIFWGIYTSTQGKSLTSATIAISTSHRCLNSADTSYHTQGKSTSALYVAKPCGTPTPCGPTNVYTQGRDLTQCELCGKAYTMATKLRCHMKSHLEEKSYKCPTCGAGYTLMQSLVRHQFSHQKREDS